ncbi:MAG: GDYXXLXY domain-containing protein [Alcanivorax jadensis]|uniref:GDYXXLXY domain-containing protein n=1 Tax=Alcanivorax jadensis TaxID=64988 RepID=UPI003001C4C5
MKQRTLRLALLAALTLQVAILAGVFVNGFYPLWLGKEIRLETRPVDPRDLFRGNYARLGYDFSTLPTAGFRPGDVIYLPLEQDGQVWRGQTPAHQPPEQGIYLRGRVSGSPWGGASRVTFGIEALFAPKEKALQLERELRDGAVAVVKVAPNGRAALVTVETEAVNSE